jgi:hypothetical protein
MWMHTHMHATSHHISISRPHTMILIDVAEPDPTRKTRPTRYDPIQFKIQNNPTLNDSMPNPTWNPKWPNTRWPNTRPRPDMIRNTKWPDTKGGGVVPTSESRRSKLGNALFSIVTSFLQSSTSRVPENQRFNSRPCWNLWFLKISRLFSLRLTTA